MSASAASDVYTHVLAFLVANGLTKTAKVFRKETGVEEPGDLDVVAMYDAYLAANPPEPKKKKKRARAEESVAEPAPEEAPPAKKAKKVAPASPEMKTKTSPKVAAVKSPKKSPKQSPKQSPKATPPKVDAAPPLKEPPTRFRRVESEKWESTIKNDKLRITAHKDKGGDNWGDKAAEDLLKVKGRDFRKEMAKKKKASWRGGGTIDQGVNSIKFDSDSD
jgi:outer membrane biosynthesis protein TonB